MLDDIDQQYHDFMRGLVEEWALIVIAEIQAEGTNSMREIARALNERHVPSPLGGRWYSANVNRLLIRASQSAQGYLH